MATTTSTVLKPLSFHQAPRNPSKPSRISALPTRRDLLFFLTSTAALSASFQPCRAKDIPLFGLRKSLKKAEEEAEVIVKEGFEAADKGVEAAERGVEAVEKGVEGAEREVEEVLSFGGLAQAGVVAGAEVVGVLVATSVVNGILGPEAQKS